MSSLDHTPLRHCYLSLQVWHLFTEIKKVFPYETLQNILNNISKDGSVQKMPADLLAVSAVHGSLRVHSLELTSLTCHIFRVTIT